MSGTMRMRTPSPKTVTFDPSPPTSFTKNYRFERKMHFRDLKEWEQYLKCHTFCFKKIFLILQGTFGKSSETRSPGYGQPTQPSSGYGTAERRPFNNNLSELDTLLQDLSNSPELHQNRYANVGIENGANGSYNGTYSGSGGRSPANYSSRPSSAQNTLGRPPVDSLLDQLNAGEVIYTGPKKVTITVKETKTETGFPGETELISRDVTRVHTSSATRELDDLMASLSDFKVSFLGPDFNAVLNRL
nr:paxillin-like [Onthophagus taurus]